MLQNRNKPSKARPRRSDSLLLFLRLNASRSRFQLAEREKIVTKIRLVLTPISPWILPLLQKSYGRLWRKDL